MIIKKFNDFDEIDIDSIVNFIPDSDIPRETNIIKQIGDKWIYTEGWCDRCFTNYNVFDRDEKIELARDLTKKRLEAVPNLPQYKYLKGKILIDWRFIELTDNEVNYALSIGVYK